MFVHMLAIAVACPRHEGMEGTCETPAVLVVNVDADEHTTHTTHTHKRTTHTHTTHTHTTDYKGSKQQKNDPLSSHNPEPDQGPPCLLFTSPLNPR